MPEPSAPSGVKFAVPLTLIMNGASGKQDSERLQPQLRELFAARGMDVRFVLLESDTDIRATVKRAVRDADDIVIAAGGDGTISMVAEAAIACQKTLGVLPLGTHNHFARDLKIPLTLPRAVDVLREAHVATIDVGEVNGEMFLNNSSVGFYPAVVRHRENQRREFGRPKWLALIVAIFAVAWRRFPMVRVTLTADGNVLHRRTPVVFVGNNEYDPESRDIGSRKCLDAGKLCVFVAHATHPAGLVRLAIRALAGKLRAAKDFDRMTTDEVTIECSGRSRLSVSKDGEVVRLAPPLRYRIRCAALRVIAPRTEAMVG